MKQRFSEEQIIAILQEAESAPTKAEVCRKHGISEWTYYRWRQQYQGLNVSQLRKLKQLEQENERLKRLVAEQALAQETLREVLAKRGIR
jgi:putative transposase